MSLQQKRTRKQQPSQTTRISNGKSNGSATTTRNSNPKPCNRHRRTNSNKATSIKIALLNA